MKFIYLLEFLLFPPAIIGKKMLHINNEKFKSWHHKKRTATTVKRRARKTVKRQLIWILTPLKIYPLQLILVTGYLVRQENLNSLKKLNKKANDARTHWALLPVYRKGIIHTINSRPNQSNRVIHSEKYESPSLQEEFRQTKSESFLKVHFNSLFLLFLLKLESCGVPRYKLKPKYIECFIYNVCKT